MTPEEKAAQWQKAERIIDYVNDVVDTSSSAPDITALLAEARRLMIEVDPQKVQVRFTPDWSNL